MVVFDVRVHDDGSGQKVAAEVEVDSFERRGIARSWWSVLICEANGFRRGPVQKDITRTGR